MTLQDEWSHQPEALAGLADQDRMEELLQSGLLTAGPNEVLDRVSRIAAALLQAPGAYVNLVGREYQVSVGASVEGVPDPPRRRQLDTSICQYQVVTGEELVINDTHTDSLTRNGVARLDPATRAYAGIPLSTRTGHVLGSLCVADHQEREWSEQQLELLRDLAALATEHLDLRIDEGRRARSRAAMEQLQHRVQDLRDAVTSLVEFAEQQDVPQLQLSAARARASSDQVGSASLLLGGLQERRMGLAAQAATTTDLRRTVERAVTAARRSTGTDAVDLELLDGSVVVRCRPLQLERALTHLLVSALHHLHGPERLQVRLTAAPVDGAGQDVARLALSSAGIRFPAAELARVVARFAASTFEDAGTTPGSAALRLGGGAVHARSGAVSATSGPSGLQFTASWSVATQDRVHRLP